MSSKSITEYARSAKRIYPAFKEGVLKGQGTPEFRGGVLRQTMKEVKENANKDFFTDNEDLREKCLLGLRIEYPEQNWKELSDYQCEEWGAKGKVQEPKLEDAESL